MSHDHAGCTAHGCATSTGNGAGDGAASSLVAELQEMALDPTLDSCCRRDLQQQIQAERIRQALKQDDRTEARQRMAAAAIRRTPQAPAPAQQADDRAPALQQPHQHHLQLPEQAADSRSDEDGELQRLRQQRLRQLQAESAAKQEGLREGYGMLNTVPESSVVRLCCQDPGRGLVVMHLAVQGHEPCNMLDECLEQAAAQYRGTYFARAVVSRGSPLVSQLQLPHGVPALLVAKQGALLGKAHIQQFGGADIWEEQVTSYLQRFKVLSKGGSSLGASHPAAAARRPGGSSDEESAAGSDDDEAADWQTPCEVCGRTYPHEHIRSVYSTQQAGSDDDDS